MQNFKYNISAFMAFVLWGFFSLALKPIAYVPSFDILFYRITFSAIIIISFILLFRRKIFLKDLRLFKNLPTKERKKGIYLTLIGGILLGINWFLFIYVVNQINVQSASFAYLVCPIITTFLATIILKERLKKSQWIAVLISFIGCLLCFISNPNNLFFALIIAFTYAFYLISQRSNSYFDKLNVLTIQIILIFILSLPYYFVNGFSIPANPTFYMYILAIATLFTLVPLYMNLYALKGAPASNVGVMLYINPLIAFALAIFYYKEYINTLQIVSYFLILLAVFIFNYRILTNLTKKNIN